MGSRLTAADKERISRVFHRLSADLFKDADQGAVDRVVLPTLFDQLRKVKRFLGGDGSHTPDGKELCELIQFCYRYEYYPETAALFDAVGEDSVETALYQKTKKIAQASRLHLE